MARNGSSMVGFNYANTINNISYNIDFILIKPSGLKRTLLLLAAFASVLLIFTFINSHINLLPLYDNNNNCCLGTILAINTLLLIQKNKISIADIFLWKKLNLGCGHDIRKDG